jgi:5-formyltetrahydrofolate cyclo-ligase
LQEISKCEDNLEAISFQVELILKQFQNLIEKQDLWRIFWTKSNNKDIHVKEFYSQMLFCVVCNSWLKAQNSNIQLFREYNKEAKQIDLRFTISSKFNVLVQIKHTNNNKLEEGYKKQLQIHKESKNSKCLFTIINFNEKESRQLEDIRLIKQKYCKVFEIDCVQIQEYSSLFPQQGW